jgi:hypothetical protein
LPPPKAEHEIHQELNLDFPAYCTKIAPIFSFKMRSAVGAFGISSIFYGYVIDVDSLVSLGMVVPLIYVLIWCYYAFDIYCFKRDKTHKLSPLNGEQLAQVHFQAKRAEPIQAYIDAVFKIRPSLCVYDLDIVRAYVSQHGLKIVASELSNIKIEKQSSLNSHESSRSREDVLEESDDITHHEMVYGPTSIGMSAATSCDAHHRAAGQD